MIHSISLSVKHKKIKQPVVVVVVGVLVSVVEVVTRIGVVVVAVWSFCSCNSLYSGSE